MLPNSCVEIETAEILFSYNLTYYGLNFCKFSNKIEMVNNNQECIFIISLQLLFFPISDLKKFLSYANE